MKPFLIALRLVLVAPGSQSGDGAEQAPPRSLPSLHAVDAGRTTFEEVRAEWGPAEATRPPGDEGAPVKICYLSARPADATVVMFESGAPGGFGERASVFKLLARAPPGLDKASCRPSDLVHRGLALSDGLRLGARVAEARRRYGAPTKIEQGLWFYAWQNTRPVTVADRTRFEAATGKPLRPTANDIGVLSRIRLDVRGGRIAGITVSRVEAF